MPSKISLVKNQTTQDLLWNPSGGNPFNDDGISAIPSDKENVEVPVTSIPSPYAQMHLFDTAFAHVNTEYDKSTKGEGIKTPEEVLDEVSTYNRAISDCLDIFELLYSFDILALGNRISISTWDKNELTRLKENGHHGQKTFAETLESYASNYSADERFHDPRAKDGDIKAFDQFVIIYVDDKALAAGSPLTGFFFNRELKLPEINRLNGKEFFSGILPLYRRDIEFQIFLSIFFGGNAKAVKAFSGLNQYRINNNQVGSDKELHRIVTLIENKGPEAIPDEYKGIYKSLMIGGNSPLYLLGETEEMQFKYKAVNSGDHENKAGNSDYAVRSGKTLTAVPLMLIEKSSKKHWKLLDGPLDEGVDLIKDLHVPVEKRVLPGTTIPYPWIQQGDLFADNLIQLRYDVNEERFWAFGDTSVNASEVKNILLPIKPAYFKYFTVEDLKKQLSVERTNSGTVVVKLNIPVKGDSGTGIITLRKKYTKTVNPENEKGSPEKGAIVNSSFGFGIYPFFKVDNPLYNDQYKVLQYCDENESVHCEFLREKPTSDYDSVVVSQEVERTTKEEGQLYKSKYTELSVFEYSDNSGTTIKDKEITFDIVVVKIANAANTVVSQGIVLPLFPAEKSIQTNSSSTIAFDIGTSNSYVAWSSGDDDQVSDFNTYNSSTSAGGLHLALLHKPEYNDFTGSSVFDFNSKNNDILRFPQLAEFIPSLIGAKDEFSLPIPTVINQDNDTDPSSRKSLSSLVNINIPFGYGVQALRTHGAQGMVLDQLFSNLKWAISKKSDASAKNRLFLFIDQLVWMARNKVLSMGLDPGATQVIWFKPLSMGSNQRGVFTEIWNEVYDKYFGKEDVTKRNKNVTSVTESWAPFFSQKQAFGAGSVYMNIDIGGGTTDVLVFKDEQPALTTSFRFAGNALFEGGLKRDSGIENGFYVKYESLMLKEFDNNPKVKRIIKGITSSKGLRSSDLINYFFQLKEFRDGLKLDEDFQLLFLLHNAAIFYHAAQTVKMGGFDQPNKIGLSGNGAKLFFITNRGEDLNRYKGMGELVSRTFSHVFDTEPDDDMIELEVLENPKNATAIGGIKGLDKIKRQKDKDIRSFSVGLGDNATLLKGKRELEDYSYRQIRNADSTAIGKVVENVNEFFEFFFEELWFDVDFTDSFGLSKAFDRKELKGYFCDKRNIESSIRTAVNNKIDNDGIDEFSETLFFYAVTEYIFQFSKILANKANINKFQH